MIPLLFLLSASAFAQSAPVSCLYRTDCTTVRVEESGLIVLARIRASDGLPEVYAALYNECDIDCLFKFIHDLDIEYDAATTDEARKALRKLRVVASDQLSHAIADNIARDLDTIEDATRQSRIIT
jgi:hypothetical protein